VKYASPVLKFGKYKSQLISKFVEILQSDSYILGNEVHKFEKSFSELIGSKYGIGLNSCTDALTIGLRAAGIIAGDQVITSALTAPATIISILNSGAIPVIVDINSETKCISPKEIEKYINKETKAIIPVHLHGFPAEMQEIIDLCKENQIKIIEDCAQSIGATYKGKKVGTFGIAGAFSFYPTKNLSALGDAGALITDDYEIYKTAVTLRNYGIDQDWDIKIPGFNSRLDEFHAGFLNIMLADIENLNQRRWHYANQYHKELSEFNEYLPPLQEGSVYHQFSLKVPKREKFIAQAKQLGLELGIHYPFTMKSFTSFQKFCKPIPEAEKLSKKIVSLPIQPEVLDINFPKIVSILKRCLENQ
jgi:dTDP-4-amino-4,6-dideoxygalactose transaminase